jgi:hypothetical protein
MILAEARTAPDRPAAARPMPEVEALIEARHGWQRFVCDGATVWFRG